MSLIAGWKTKALSQSHLNARCTHCGQSGLVLITTQSYYTLFWIPTFPLKKKRAITCLSCQTVFASDAYAFSAAEGQMPKTPWWAFTGLVLIAGIVVGGVYVVQRDSELTQMYSQNPRVGDVVFVSTKDNGKTWYSYFKIARIENDKILVHASRHSFSKYKGTLDEYENARVGVELSEDLLELTKESFQKLKIQMIKRPD